LNVTALFGPAGVQPTMIALERSSWAKSSSSPLRRIFGVPLCGRRSWPRWPLAISRQAQALRGMSGPSQPPRRITTATAISTSTVTTPAKTSTQSRPILTPHPISRSPEVRRGALFPLVNHRNHVLIDHSRFSIPAAIAGEVRSVARCKSRGHRAEPDIAEQIAGRTFGPVSGR
jgi:hypothetical protein